MRSWITEGDTIPWIVERGGERAPETMETNAAISGENDASGTPGHCQSGQIGCNHDVDDFAMSYEAICVGACSLFRDEALGR